MRNLAELEFGLTGVLMTTTPPPVANLIPGKYGIDPGLGAAATRVSATSSHLQVPALQ